MIFGAIEAGGTKMVCALVNKHGKVLERVTIPTRTPEETIPEMIAYFKDKYIAALGIGCFGPLDLKRTSDTFGCITHTPKTEWANYPIRKVFSDALGIPVGIDTDVNAAVLAEVTHGIARGCENAIYITIGTGIGVGVYCNGKLLHGLVHPEAGHILITKANGDSFEGCCPFHRNCFEGLASGPAIEKRWGKPASLLTNQQDVWDMEAYYIAQAICNYIMTYSPEKIILWGGVMHQTQLYKMVREQVVNMLGGYVQHKSILKEIDSYIVPPELGEDPGIIGSALLGQEEYYRQQQS